MDVWSITDFVTREDCPGGWEGEYTVHDFELRNGWKKIGRDLEVHRGSCNYVGNLNYESTYAGEQVHAECRGRSVGLLGIGSFELYCVTPITIIGPRGVEFR